MVHSFAKPNNCWGETSLAKVSADAYLVLFKYTVLCSRRCKLYSWDNKWRWKLSPWAPGFSESDITV